MFQRKKFCYHTGYESGQKYIGSTELLAYRRMKEFLKTLENQNDR